MYKYSLLEIADILVHPEALKLIDDVVLRVAATNTASSKGYMQKLSFPSNGLVKSHGTIFETKIYHLVVYRPHDFLSNLHIIPTIEF